MGFVKASGTISRASFVCYEDSIFKEYIFFALFHHLEHVEDDAQPCQQSKKEKAGKLQDYYISHSHIPQKTDSKTPFPHH